MKISKKYTRLALLLILLTAFFSVSTYAQVVYKGFNSATAKGTALGKEVNDNSNSGTIIVKNNDDPTQIIFPMIGLAKTAGNPVVQNDGTYNVTYTLRVQNYSTIALNNVQITDNLKSVFLDDAANAKFKMVAGTFEILTPSATNGTGAIAINTGFNGDTDQNLLLPASSSLTSNASGTGYFATIRFTINVDTKGIAAAYKTYNNTATTTASTVISPEAPTSVLVTDVSHNDASPNQSDNTKTPLAYNAPTPIALGVADIKVTKIVSNSTPNVNTNVTFTIKVENIGPGDAAPVVVNDLLPAGFEYVSKTVNQGTYNEVTGIWSVGTLLVGTTNAKTLTVTAKVLPNKTVAQYTNTASSNHPLDPVATNNSAQVVVTPNKVADLKITNTDGKTTYTPGTTNTYTIVVTNDGPSDVTGATVTNTLPPGFTGTWTAVYDGGATGTASGSGSISESVNMPTGSKVTYTYTVNVPSGYTGSYANTATVTAPAGVTDPTPLNNTATDTDTQSSSVDLKVEKIADNMSPVVGDPIKFTVSVTNLGPSDGSGIKVTDLLKPGYTFVSATVGAAVAAYDKVTGIWTIGNLAYNETVSLVVTATVVADAKTADYANTATVAGTEPDPVLTNNTVIVQPTPLQLVDLVMKKTVSNTTPEVASEITFELSVLNNGPSIATNVVVNDLLQAGYTYVSSTPSVGAYNPTSGVWTIGSVNVAQEVKMQVKVSVNANASSAGYVNTAVVSAKELERITSNNTATVSTVTPVPLADLEIVKVASMLSPSVNSTIEFTLTATNKGLSNATGVTVTDLLTAGFKFVSATPSVGTYNQTTGIWAIGNLNLGATASLKIKVIVNGNGPYVNTATIKGIEKDPIQENNTSTVVLTSQATPVAVDDVVKACATGPMVIDILANDIKSVSNIDPSTVVITKQPTNGKVTIDPITGKATYTPNAGYTGNDQFSYTVKDANGGTSNEAQVKITVNQAIVALNDFASTDPNLPVVIDILANDIVGSTAIVPGSIIITQQPVNGTITIDATGKVTYTPKNNYVGTDSFKYTVKDASGCTSNVATVDIKVNDLPKIGLAKAATSVVKQQNGSYNITYHFVVGNYGTSVLSNVSIKDDLKNTFKGDAFSVKSITSLGTLKVNPQYNGASIIELLATGNSLAVGEKQQLEIVVNVVVGRDKVTYLNSAIAEGSSITGKKDTDVSTDGLVPDANGDVSPSVPTPVDLSRPKEFIPGGFSPNGDGKNDTFVISNTGNKRISLEIYNRWANRVYRNADYKNDWAGQSNEGIRISSDLPEGTYFYIIVIDGKDKYVGSITLKR